MVERRHWAKPGFSALVLMTLAACSGGGGGGGGGAGGSPSGSASVPPVVDGGAGSTGSGGTDGATGSGSAGAGATTPPPPPPSAPSGTAERYATAGSDTPDKLGRLTVFGDSYSDLNGRWTRPDQVWSARLVNSVPGASLNSLARSSASALDGGVYGDPTNDFKTQVDRWAAGPNLDSNELTIVYMGYNDVNMLGLGDHGASIADYETQVQRLIGGGATASERRLFLTLLHDFGTVPKELRDPGSIKSQTTRDMNSGIADIVNGKDNVVAVDMFTVFNRIAANPARYGLTNVTDFPGAGDDSSTFLYADRDHFGARGQEILAQVYNHYLTRGEDLANSLQGSETNRNQLNDEVDNRLAELALVEGGALGFSSFFVGDDEAAGIGDYAVEMGDPSRSGFAQLTRASRPDAGVGLNYALDGDTRLGVVMSRYGSDHRYDLADTAARLDTESDAVSLYFDTKAGAFDLRTRASFAEDTHTKVTFNDVVDEGHTARHGGSTVSLSQTASTNLRLGRAWLQPWLNLTHTEQQIDGYTISDPFVSDLTYSGGSVTDTVASLGLVATSDAFDLGGHGWLTLTGGISYTRSLRADDYEVTIEEAAVPGLQQTERVEREGAEVFEFRLGSAFEMDENLSLSADYTLTKPMGVAVDHAVTARFNYRF